MKLDSCPQCAAAFPQGSKSCPRCGWPGAKSRATETNGAGSFPAVHSRAIVGTVIFWAGAVVAGLLNFSAVTDSSAPLSMLQQFAPLVSGAMMLMGAVWYVVCKRRSRT